MFQAAYRGRFAPSPTGPLHFGSLVAALASRVDAMSHGGQWLLRIDDLDQTRALPGMDRHIISTLDALGFAWDGDIAYQSQTTNEYREALAILLRGGRVYFCECSRRQVAMASQRMGLEGPIYPGTCRDAHLADRKGRSARVLTETGTVTFRDRLFGPRSQDIAREIGDFVIRRADRLFAYQLAVVIDDWKAGINHVVRGADLLSSTPRQIWLHQLLGLSIPAYLHVPLVYDALGRKLSKSDQAHPVDTNNPVPSLLRAWRFLGQPEPDTDDMSLAEFWDWAPAQWETGLIRKEAFDE